MIPEAFSHLEAEGFAVVEGLFPKNLIETLALEAKQISTTAAGIGRQTGHQHDTAIRRTRIAWLDGTSDAQRDFLAQAEKLRLELNRRLFLGLFEFEAQYGISDPGGFYRRHLDSFAGARNRRVSLVTYLNSEWSGDQGGELLIWRNPEDTGSPVATVLPRAGVSVLMLSEEIPHEVCPSNTTRYAIAGWWRVNHSET